MVTRMPSFSFKSLFRALSFFPRVDKFFVFASGNLEKYCEGKWTVIQPAERLRLTKQEAQARETWRIEASDRIGRNRKTIIYICIYCLKQEERRGNEWCSVILLFLLVPTTMIYFLFAVFLYFSIFALFTNPTCAFWKGLVSNLQSCDGAGVPS